MLLGVPAPTPAPTPTPTPAISNSIVQWGDSLTRELGSALLSNRLNNRRVVNRGVSSQTSAEIAGRQGGFNVNCRIEGGQIPASGPVTLTSTFPQIARNTQPNGVQVRIAGVVGTLRPSSTNSSVYEFTRSTNGSIVPAPSTQLITPITTDIVNGITFDLNTYVSILWLGRNGVNAGPGQTDVTIYQGMLNKIANPKKVIILPIFNGGYNNESIGLSGYIDRMDRNESIANAFPNYWFDVRRKFIDGAEDWFKAKYPTEYARDWNRDFKPTRAQDAMGPNSAWDVSNDVPPRALRRDLIHLNNFGNEFLAELIADRIKELNF
jgi:hypothetical protein